MDQAKFKAYDFNICHIKTTQWNKINIKKQKESYAG